MPSLKTSSEKIISLLSQYQKVRSHSEFICEPLEVEDYVVQPVMDVSPPKWHLAHTTWFFENFILVPHKKGYKVFDPNHAYLFNSYYITAGDRWTRAARGHLTRPTVKDIYAYRKYVDDQMIEFLDSISDISEELKYVFEIGFQHEQQHQELLFYDIKYILGHNPLFPAYKDVRSAEQSTPDINWLRQDSGMYQIGHQEDGFCFDNELNAHEVFLPAFEIRSGIVSNAEFLEFINAGGYDDSTLWLSEGWDWVNQNQINAPMYWHRMDDQWHVYTLSGLKPMDPYEPVSHVSFYEADAFARWKGVRLPTEFEWEVACRHFEPTIPKAANFVENDHLKPISEGTQFYGNLWDWTESAYRPYPGYKPVEGTLGEYNGKFMMNTMVLRGGSYATSRDHIRPTYRNFFHPHLQWMFSGIRLAKYV